MKRPTNSSSFPFESKRLKIRCLFLHASKIVLFAFSLGNLALFSDCLARRSFKVQFARAVRDRYDCSFHFHPSDFTLQI